MTLFKLMYPCRYLCDFVDEAIIEKEFKITKENLSNFIELSGDKHPVHTDSDFAKARGYSDVVVHGMCVAAHCSAFLTEHFIGRNCLLLSVNYEFRSPIFCDMLLTWRARPGLINKKSNLLEVKWEVLGNKNVVMQRGFASIYIGDYK